MQENVGASSVLEEMTNEQLVVLANQGNEESFRVLLDRLGDVITSSVTLYLDRFVESEDMFQEAHLAFLNAVRHYDPERNASFRTFAAVCINNRLLNFIKSKSSKIIVSQVGFADIDDSCHEISDASETPGPEDVIIDRERFNQTGRMIKELLSPLEYDVLMQILEGKSYEETAKELELNVKSVDNAMQRVRKKLKNILG